LERKQRVFSTQHAFINRFTDKTKNISQYTNMNDMQQPGGLTDAQFDENPNQCAVVIGLAHLGMYFH
jgi:hypothetical protein